MAEVDPDQELSVRMRIHNSVLMSHAMCYREEKHHAMISSICTVEELIPGSSTTAPPIEIVWISGGFSKELPPVAR
jgi:hypothetical protein